MILLTSFILWLISVYLYNIVFVLLFPDQSQPNNNNNTESEEVQELITRIRNQLCNLNLSGAWLIRIIILYFIFVLPLYLYILMEMKFTPVNNVAQLLKLKLLQ